MTELHGTTIVCVRRNGKVAIAGDGQVTQGNQVLKNSARKVRRLASGRVIAGFAGATADAFTLFEKFEEKIQQYPDSLQRAAVELAKEWRTNKMLRTLEAMLIVADTSGCYLLTGAGDVVEPDDDVLAIGSGGAFAQAAALALTKHTGLTARQICEEALQIASRICIYTNSSVQVEELG